MAGLPLGQPAMQAVFDGLGQSSVHPDEIDRSKLILSRIAAPGSPHPDQVMKPNIHLLACGGGCFAVHEGRHFGAWDVSEAALARRDIHALSNRFHSKKIGVQRCFPATAITGDHHPDLR